MATLSDEYIEHERAIMPMMTNQHWGLTHEFDAKMRASFLENVKTKNIELIQSWVGTDEDIHKTLFWFSEGKFDDEAWQGLEPVDAATKKLWAAAKKRLEALAPEAVKCQRMADLSLFSFFNTGLIFTGLAPAVRCDESGAPTADGSHFKGVEFRVVGSVPGQTDSITIWPTDEGYEVGFGARTDDGFAGIPVNAVDFYSLKVLVSLMDRGLGNAGIDASVKDTQGQPVELDKRAISKAIRTKQSPEYGDTLTLLTSKQAATPTEAIEAADTMITRLYESFGLEREALNLGRELGNFYVLRDANFDEFISGAKLDGRKGVVFLTATLVCRRCRREVASFYEWAKANPLIAFVLVNLNTPLEPFYNRVFFDMGGENFRSTAQGVTPFVVPYKPGAEGLEYGGEYIATEKAEALTEDEEVMAMFKRHFGD